MQELEITWRHVLSVWWLIAWRGPLVGFLFAIGIAFAIGFVEGFVDDLLDDLRPATTIVVFILTWAWWIYVVRMALRKKYKGFRLALIPEPSN